MPYEIDVALLSNNGILREGLRHILTAGSFRITAAVSDAEDIVFPPRQSGEENPQIIIVDDGSSNRHLEVCGILHESYPEARVVVLADRFDFEAVVAAFRDGVDGYLVKEISSEPLIGALRLIALGEKVLPSEMATCMGDCPFPITSSPELADVNLSEREIEVLKLLILGSANKVIGRRLGICEATVKVHVKAALRKLHVENRTQAAIWAVQRGLAGYEGSDAAASLGNEAAIGRTPFRFGNQRARDISMASTPLRPGTSLLGTSGHDILLAPNPSRPAPAMLT